MTEQHLQVIQYVALLATAGGAAWFDLRTGLIPNRLTLPAMAAGLATAAGGGLLIHGWTGFGAGLAAASIGLLAGLIPFAVLFLSGLGLGGGDAKLMGAVGALSASWVCVLGTSIYALILAMLMATVLMARHGLMLRTLQRILTAGLTASAGVRPTMPSDSPRVPFAAAAFIGAAVAGAEALLGLELPWSP